MKIAYITSYDASDIKQWSGSGYFIWKSLANRGHDVELIGSLKLTLSLRLFLNLKKMFYSRIRGKTYIADHDLMVARAYSREVGRRLNSYSGIDVLISPGTIPVALLSGKIPLVICADATHSLLFSTYPGYEKLTSLNILHGDLIESAAHQRAAAIVFASQWAADSAINDYGTNSSKVHVMPFGANLENSPTISSVLKMIEARDRRQLKLLFIGVDWERKGGPVVLSVVRHLISIGIPTRLAVIGCRPNIKGDDSEFVTIYGFLGKDSDGQRRIQEEMARSHFLIVPSTAECYGLVYCEASSFGVPSVARSVGGVASTVHSGRNGQLFEMTDSPVKISEWIASVFRDFDSYRKLAISAFSEYETHLSWKVAGEKLEAILLNVISISHRDKLKSS